MILSDLTILIFEQFSRGFRTEKSKQVYLAEINMFCEHVKKDFMEIQKEDVSKYFHFCKERVLGEKMKRSTLIKKFSELSSFAKYVALQKERVPEIPVTFVNDFDNYLAAYKEQKKVIVPSVRDMDLIFQAAQDNLMHYTILTLIYRLGIRPNCICSITNDNFFTDPTNNYYCKIINKSNAFQVLVLPDDVRDIMIQYAKTRDTQNQYFFYNRVGRPLNEKYLERMINAITKKANVRNWTLQDIRNASANLMFAYDATPSQVATELGITNYHIRRYKDVMHYNSQDTVKDLVKIHIDPPQT